MACSLHICSTQRSHVHRVWIHGISNQDTHLYLAHNNSPLMYSIHNNSSDNRWSTALWVDHRWNAEFRKTLDFVPSAPTWHHPPGIELQITACVLLDRLLTGVRRFYSTLAYTNCIWSFLRLVSVAQNRQLSMFYSTALSSRDTLWRHLQYAGVPWAYCIRFSIYL